MSPLPLTAIHTRKKHRVDEVSFSAGSVLCSCSERINVGNEPTFDRDQALLLAFQEHRRSAGAGVAGEIGYDRTGEFPVFRINQRA